jgi:hypothetical protein
VAVKTRFHDRHERIDYLKLCEVAQRIIADPALIESVRRFVETAMLPDPHQYDPHQYKYGVMWRELLAKPASEIAAALVEDSERGRLLRETRPVFGRGPTSREAVALVEEADAAAR